MRMMVRIQAFDQRLLSDAPTPAVTVVGKPATRRTGQGTGTAWSSIRPLRGYGVIELHRLLIDFRVQAFTMSHPLRWAFGYYAVCWLLLNHRRSYLRRRYRCPSCSLATADGSGFLQTFPRGSALAIR